MGGQLLVSGTVLVMLVSGCDRECDPAPWRAAHDCVIEAATLEQPFVVRWRIGTIEGFVQVAFVAQGAGETWSLVQVSRNVSTGGEAPPTVTSSCSELLDQGRCTNVLGTLCVECGGRTVTDECAE